MTKLLAAIVVALLAPIAAAGCQQRSAERELHVVSVHEGEEGLGDEVPRRIRVSVDRKGKSVSLVLVAHTPVSWQVGVADGTKIEQIVTGGIDQENAEVVVNGKPFAEIVRRSDIAGADEMQGQAFRDLVENTPATLGFKRIDSFAGAHEAPPEGFAIAMLDRENELLDPDFTRNQVVAGKTLPRLTFTSNLRGQVGVYSLSGDKVGDATIMERRNAAYVPESKSIYSLSSRGLVRTSVDGETSEVIKTPAGMLAVRWPSAIAYDPKRHLLVGLSGGGEGVMHAYDPIEERWVHASSLGLRGLSPAAIEYDKGAEAFLVTLMGDESLQLGRMYSSFEMSFQREIAYEELTGFADLYDTTNASPPAIDILTVDGSKVVLSTDALDFIPTRPDRVESPPTRIYLYDLKTGSADLTYVGK